MTDVLRALIPAMWLLWLAYWVLAGRNNKAALRRENSLSRLSHYGPLILGGALIGIPNSAGRVLELPFHAVTPGWLLAATALVATGLGFSALARIWLGRNWSAEVTVKHDHELIRSGPYALVRHPIYAGALLALLGTAISVDKWRAVLGFVLVVMAFVRKLTIEERFMSEQFGDAYARYRAEVPALIPFVV
jgi:protein-S-isoprenylcysteine O-methyltransferase Ste14